MNNTTDFVDNETRDVLTNIPELGFVTIRDGKVLDSMSPQFNVYSNVVHYEPYWRWELTLQYLKEYSTHHPDFTGSFYVCLYDGFREYSTYVVPSRRRYVSLDSSMYSLYSGKGNANEPRFVHSEQVDSCIYPELNCPVLAYNRHTDDRNTYLLPDAHFLSDEHVSYMKQVHENEYSWIQKKEHCVLWRGSRNTPSYIHTPYTYNSHGMYGYHIRDIAVEFSRRGVVPGLDASFEYMSINDQLQYKYLLTCDGLVSAWSATAWKLRSNSVLMLLKSSWEHWYSNLLIPDEHYVSIDTLFDIPSTLKWMQTHNEHVLRINERAQCLGSLILTCEYAVKDYNIRH